MKVVHITLLKLVSDCFGGSKSILSAVVKMASLRQKDPMQSSPSQGHTPNIPLIKSSVTCVNRKSAGQVDRTLIQT